MKSLKRCSPNRNTGNAHGGWQGELLDSFQQAVNTGGASESQMAVIRDDVPAAPEAVP